MADHLARVVPRLLLLGLVAALLGTAARVAGAADPTTRVWTVEGVERRAVVYAPVAGAAAGKVPVVFAFHGHGGTAPGAARSMRFQDAWPQAIVVYLEGLPTPSRLDPLGRLGGWQVEAGQEGDRDLKAFDAVLATLRGEYSVDDRRVYAAGFSNGAGFAYLLWGERAKTVAAFGCCAGRVGATVQLTEPRPAVIVAGREDPRVPIADQMQTVEGLRRLDGATGPGQTCGEGCTHFASSGGTPVTVWVHDGGHVFPPGTADRMVAFFRAQGDSAAGATPESAVPSAPVASEEVTFPGPGYVLHGFLYKPAGAGPFPAVLVNHGSEALPGDSHLLAAAYVARGYVYFFPHRHGHGRSPPRTDDIQHRIAAVEAQYAGQSALLQQKIVELHEQANLDVVAALEWLTKQPFVDPKRIVMSGCSFGGIQTLLSAEKGLNVRAFVPFAPGAMSWRGVPLLHARLVRAVANATAPIFLVQAHNDYDLGPSETLGPVLDRKGAPNGHRVYPDWPTEGASHEEGHGGFFNHASDLWGRDVFPWLRERLGP